MACQNGHTNVVIQLLLRAHAFVDMANAKGFAPLYAASLSGHADVVELLLDGGASVNQPDGKGYTPLHVSCQKGHVATIN